jgi:arylsulfatase A
VLDSIERFLMVGFRFVKVAFLVSFKERKGTIASVLCCLATLVAPVLPSAYGQEKKGDAPAAASAKPIRRPNVVYIMADDLGYGDVRSFGQDRSRTETPHFDRLAREGMRFTNAYSICSVCVPSRMAVMTGRYPWRFSKAQRGGPWGFLGLQFPTDHFTIGRLMQSAGYRTGYVGKWHLGTTMQTTNGKIQDVDNVDYTKRLKAGPTNYGFDESFVLPGSLDMYPYAYVCNGEWVGKVTAQKGWSAFNRVGPAAEDFTDTEVLDTFCRQAENFLASSTQGADAKPFFLYLALTSPHTPLSPSAKFEGKSKLGLYGDFVAETDDCVGRVLAALEKHGISQNTVVIATSDHGAANYAGRRREATFGQLKELEQDGHYSSGVFRGYKFSAFEGGFRVPFVVRWPGVAKADSVCEQMVSLIDLAATLRDISGASTTPESSPDSISILSLLRDSATTGPRESVILQATRAYAIRKGNWKLLFCPGSGCDEKWLIAPGHIPAWRNAIEQYGKPVSKREQLLQPPFIQLYDLSSDPSETTNLASKYPDRVRELSATFESLVSSGRSTPGPALKNERTPVAFQAVPPFVFGR